MAKHSQINDDFSVLFIISPNHVVPPLDYPKSKPIFVRIIFFSKDHDFRE